jgi:hypothetical protein
MKTLQKATKSRTWSSTLDNHKSLISPCSNMEKGHSGLEQAMLLQHQPPTENHPRSLRPLHRTWSSIPIGTLKVPAREHRQLSMNCQWPPKRGVPADKSADQTTPTFMQSHKTCPLHTALALGAGPSSPGIHPGVPSFHHKQSVTSSVTKCG